MIKDFNVFPTSFKDIQKMNQEGKDWVESMGGGEYTVTPVDDPEQRYLIYRFEVAERDK